jgi:hypothetical protein
MPFVITDSLDYNLMLSTVKNRQNSRRLKTAICTAKVMNLQWNLIGTSTQQRFLRRPFTAEVCFNKNSRFTRPNSDPHKFKTLRKIDINIAQFISSASSQNVSSTAAIGIVTVLHQHMREVHL